MTNARRKTAKAALAALTRLTQRCNPFDSDKLRNFLKDEEDFAKYCLMLGIEDPWAVSIFSVLQKISREKGC